MSETYIEPDKFTLISGQDVLTVYHWGDQDENHYFCQVCGIYPFHDTSYEPGKYRINLGCVDGIESRALQIIKFDGKNEL